MAANDLGPNESRPGGMDAGGGQAGDTPASRGEPSSRFDRRTARIGLVLVIIGVLALLADLGVFRTAHNLVGMAIFAVLGAFALNHYLTRQRIGSLIGAFVLFGLAAATVSGQAAGFYFLGLMGVGFAAVYLVDRGRWWAIIPAGTLLSLAVIAGLGGWAPGYDAGWVLFAGLALTFGLLYVLPGDPKPWAIYPAVAAALLAVLGVSVGGTWIVPVVLVAVGVYMLLRQGGERGRMAPAGGAPTSGAPGGAPEAPAAAPEPGAEGSGEPGQASPDGPSGEPGDRRDD